MSTRKTKEDHLKEKAQKMPQGSGVYFMKNSSLKILYIGKAKNLKSRVQSYFSNPSIKTTHLLKKTSELDYILTSTEAEAFLLEAHLIKKHRPRYNIRLKDDKAYPYIRASLKHDYPKFELVRKVNRKKGYIYFGPYPSGGAIKDVLSLIGKVFKIRDCSDSFMTNRQRPCLTHQIGCCKAPCVSLVSKEEYRQDFEQARVFLKGRKQKILKNLKIQMNEASESERFEEALQLRDQIKAIDSLWYKQSVVGKDENKESDIFGIYEDTRGSLIEVLHIRGGGIFNHRSFFFTKEKENLEKKEFLSSFLIQYYTDNLIPCDIGLSFELDEEERQTLEQALIQLKEEKVVVKNLLEKDPLLKICRDNAKSQFEKKISLHESHRKALLEIQKKLELQNLPVRIECYDISHLQGSQTVASRVVFEEGEPKKQDYRKYKISEDKVDDYACMYEVLQRRFSKDEEAEPDLILIDGGKGQLSIALKALKELKISHIPVRALAKARTQKDFQQIDIFQTEERFFIPGRDNPVLFRSQSLSFRILVQLRNEAHRFALSYHRRLRDKEYMRSELDLIPGLGPKRKQILLERVGSLEGFEKSSLEDLEKLPLFHKKIAQEVFEYFKNKKK